MAVAFSQHAAGHANTGQLGPPSNGTLVLPSVANGDVILFAALITQSGGLDSVSGCGAVWTQLQRYTGNNNVVFELWIGIVGTASGSTITFGDSSHNVIIDIAAMSFTGATQGALWSALTTGPNGGSTSIQGSSDKPFEAGQAVAVFLAWRGFQDAGSATPNSYTDSPSAFTTVDELDAVGNNTELDSAYKITAGAGTYSRQANYTDLGANQQPMAFAVLLSADPFPSPPPMAHVVQKAALTRASSW